MWCARWQAIDDQSERLDAAIQFSQMAAFAAASYNTAYRPHLDYYNGVNVVALLACWSTCSSARAGITPPCPSSPSQTSAPRCASPRRRRVTSDPVGSGTTDAMIWASATLGELAVLLGNASEAERFYSDAAGVPGVSYFQLDSMRSQLRLYERLQFNPEPVAAAMRQIE